MIWYNSREVSKELFSFGMSLVCIIWNNCFFLMSQLHLLLSYFWLYKWQGWLSTSLDIFSGPFCLWIFWKTLLFSLPCLLDFLTFAVHTLSTRDCNVDISEYVLYQVLKEPCALSYIHNSSSLMVCQNSYCVHHNISNLWLPLTVFRESCFKLCYPLE